MDMKCARRRWTTLNADDDASTLALASTSPRHAHAPRVMGSSVERCARDDALAGVAAGVACALVGHPFDTVKVFAQGCESRARASTVAATRAIYAARGVRGFYAGVSAPLIGNSLETGMNYAAFHETRRRALDAAARRNGGTTTLNDRLFASALGGGFAGAVLCVFITPFELVKCRAQMGGGGGRAWRVARETYAARGAFGLFRGFSHTLAREIPSGAIYFSSYELLQSFVPRNGASSSTVDVTEAAFEERDAAGLALEAVAAVGCGGLAGVITWLAVLPLDNAKTIFQCERPGGAHDLPPLALLGRLVRERGVSGVYRGAVPIVARAFPANAAQWLAFEFVSRSLHHRRVASSP